VFIRLHIHLFIHLFITSEDDDERLAQELIRIFNSVLDANRIWRGDKQRFDLPQLSAGCRLPVAASVGQLRNLPALLRTNVRHFPRRLPPGLNP